MHPRGGLIIEGAPIREERLINFLKIFNSLAKYFLLENREKYSCCLVYTSLVYNRTNKSEKLCSNR